MAKPLSEEELQILKASFDEYDTDKGGSISVQEFAKAMKSSGQKATDAEVQQIIDEVDRDGDGTIDFEEFVSMMTGRPVEISTSRETSNDSEYENAWKEFDPSLRGSITAAQLRQVMAGLGETVTDAEVDEISNSVDGEDKISYKEFLRFAKSRSEMDVLKEYE